MNLSTIEMIKIVAAALGELNDCAVFVGGAVIPFYLPAAYLALARPTEDIDVVMELVSHTANVLNDVALRDKGFQNDTSGRDMEDIVSLLEVADGLLGTEQCLLIAKL